MAEEKTSLINFFELEAPYVTEFNRLLHRLLTSQKVSNPKTIMVTSSMLSEGKSTICSFLALTSALKQGKKTLIIDADLRRPTLHKLFDLKPIPGLNDILTDLNDINEVITKTKIENLDIITCGSSCKNPTEVFNPEKIGQTLEELKFFYDIILIDCPPLLPVSDPMLLAPKVDGIFIVVKAGKTQKDVIRRAVDILNSEKKKILGIALNNINHSLPYYYNYEYYNYKSTADISKGSGPKLPSSSKKRDKNRSRSVDTSDQSTPKN